MVFYISNALAITHCDRIVNSVDPGGPGDFRLYPGIMPANVGVPLGAQVEVAKLVFSGQAFDAATDANPDAIAIAQAIAPDANPVGDAAPVSFYRARSADGVEHWQGNITLPGGGGDLELSDLVIVAGIPVSVLAMSFTFQEG